MNGPAKYILLRGLILAASVLLAVTSTAGYAAAPSGKEAGVVSHALTVDIDTRTGEVTGTDLIRVAPETTELVLYIRGGSSVDGVRSSGRKIRFKSGTDRSRGLKYARFKVPSSARGPGGDGIEVDFSGRFEGMEKARENIRRGVAYVEDGVVGPMGALLPSDAFWYPREAEELARFSATVTSPAGMTTVSNGRWTASERGEASSVDSWETSNPLTGLDLITAPFTVRKEEHGGVSIYTFFFEDDPALSELYTGKTRGYLDLYENLIGPYPFEKFAVVENFLPTGYGMPSMTLLGSRVLRLPFIPDTSLGHEIAHSWWGNSVFIDYGGGNWAEALTSYTADYLYEKNKGPKEAMEYRLDKLRLYKSYAGEAKLALGDFMDATTTASRAVGYDKGTMVFNMLENLVGDEAFAEALRTFYRENAFRKTTWKEIREAFEKASGERLDWFFDQWLTRPGGPWLSLGEVALEPPAGYGGPWRVAFTLTQASPAYTLDIPVVLNLEDGGHMTEVVTLSDLSAVFGVEVPSPPVSLEVDPGYEVFRILADPEVPPSLSGCLGDREGVIVLPGDDTGGGKYGPAAELYSGDYGLKVVTSDDPGVERYLRKSSVFFLGRPDENPALKLLGDRVSQYFEFASDAFAVGEKTFAYGALSVAASAKNPYNYGREVCVFYSPGGPDEVRSKAARVGYFTRESYVIFSPEGVEKGLFPAESSLKFIFHEGPQPLEGP